MSARSPLICSAVELWYKKMLKIGSLSELTGIDTKIKVAGFQRLYSKWLWLLMAVYKPLFADAKAREDRTEDFVGGYFAGYFAQIVHAFADVLCYEVGR